MEPVIETPGQAPAAPAQPQTPPAAEPAAPAQVQTGLDFIPETYRQDPSFSKYKTADDFFKGYQNLQKLVGQKQVVEGLKVPGPEASEQERNDFYLKLGRPESADKYQLPEDVKLADGLDVATEKQAFSEIAFKHGLTQEQTAGLFKEYAAVLEGHIGAKKEHTKMELTDALTAAFGDKAQENYELAKRGAEIGSWTDKLNAEGLGRHPVILQLCAKIGELTREETFVPPKEVGSTVESKLAEARKLQASPDYWSNPESQRRVEAIFKEAYPE